MSINESSVAAVPATILVHNSSELYSAVKALSATGGNIELAAGCGPFKIYAYGQGNANAPITISSQDPSQPAVVTEISLQKSTNFVIENVTVDSASVEATRSSSTKDLNILNCTDVTIRNTAFHSDANGFADGSGTAEIGSSLGTVRDTTGFTIEDSSISGYFNGLVVLDSNDTVIRDNSITHMQGDGIRLAGVANTLVENNTIGQFYGSTNDRNHDDLIQVWSSGAKQNTENLVIRGNMLDASSTAASQSIFINSETTDVFQHIVIEDNVIRNGMKNGIAVQHANDVTIRNNTVLWAPDAVTLANDTDTTPSNTVPAIRGIGTNFVVEGNIASGIYVDGDATITDNVHVDYSNPADEGYYAKHFVDAMGGVVLSPVDLMLLPGSSWAGVYGAAASSALANGEVAATTTGVLPIMHVIADTAQAYVYHFDAKLSLVDGKTLAADDRVIWHFADGSTREGVEVTRHFTGGGAQDVTLEIIHAGQSTSLERQVDVATNLLAEMSFIGGAVADKSDADLSFQVTDGALQAGGLVLDGSSKMTFVRDNAEIHNLSAFQISVDMSVQSAANTGVFLDFPNVMTASVTTGGFVTFSLKTTEGRVNLTSSEAVFDDTASHHLTFSYSDAQDLLTLSADGTQLGSISASGLTADVSYYGLTLGNTWNASLKGMITGFDFSLLPDTYVEPTDDSSDLASSALVAEPVLTTLLSFDFEGNSVVDRSGNDIAIKYATLRSTDKGVGVHGQGLDLGGNLPVQADRANAQIHDLDEFTLGVSLHRDTLTAGGKFVHFQNAMQAEVLKDGTLQFTLRTDEGVFSVHSAAKAVSDTDWHRVMVTYDDAADHLDLYLDGNLVDSATASGHTTADATYGLALGNLWANNLDATIDDFVLADGAASQTQVAADHADFAAALDTPALVSSVLQGAYSYTDSLLA